MLELDLMNRQSKASFLNKITTTRLEITSGTKRSNGKKQQLTWKCEWWLEGALNECG